MLLYKENEKLIIQSNYAFNDHIKPSAKLHLCRTLDRYNFQLNFRDCNSKQ